MTVKEIKANQIMTNQTLPENAEIKWCWPKYKKK